MFTAESRLTAPESWVSLVAHKSNRATGAVNQFVIDLVVTIHYPNAVHVAQPVHREQSWPKQTMPSRKKTEETNIRPRRVLKCITVQALERVHVWACCFAIAGSIYVAAERVRTCTGLSKAARDSGCSPGRQKYFRFFNRAGGDCTLHLQQL